MPEQPATANESPTADSAQGRVTSEPLADIFSARAPDLESAPYVEERWRAEKLYRELELLGLQQQVFELATVGYTVVPPDKVGPPEYIAALRAAVLRIAEARSGVAPDLVRGTSHSEAQHPLGQHMRMVLFDDPVFEPLVTHPVLLGLVSYLAGNDVLLSLLDCMVKGPGRTPLPPHNDHGDKTSPVYPYPTQAVTLNLLLTDYDEGSGPIAFLPGSHRFRREPTPAEMRVLPGVMKRVVAPAGSCVIWPGDTWHMAHPRTDLGLRATVLMHFCRNHLQTQGDFRTAVTPEALDRNPPRFAQLMNRYGMFPFGKDNMDPAKRPFTSKRHSLFDCHSQWQEYFAVIRER